jgi:hypothetical protein
VLREVDASDKLLAEHTASPRAGVAAALVGA